MRISTWGRVKAMKPRSCNSWLPAGKGYGVASASRLSWMRPPTVSLRNRMMQGNRVKGSAGIDEASEELVVPGGDLAPNAQRVFAGRFADQVVSHVFDG